MRSLTPSTTTDTYGRQRCLPALLVLALSCGLWGQSSGQPAAVKLQERIARLEGRVGNPRGAPETRAQDKSERELLLDILNRLDTLEKRVDRQEQEGPGVDLQEVDLSEQQIEGLARSTQQHVLARPWNENLIFSGHGTFGFLLSGSGTHEHGSFAARDSALLLDAEAWPDIFFHVEIKLSWLGTSSEANFSLWESYADLRDLADDGQFNLRVGRFDIPFGEDYLRMDSPDNALITFQAGHPYGKDEGVMAYGRLSDLAYVLAIQNGNSTRSADDSGGKSVTLKLGAEPCQGLSLSASFLHTSEASRSAWCFAGSYLTPVGSRGPSALGDSPSEVVSSTLYVIDVDWKFGTLGRLLVSFGQAFVDDEDSSFDRTLTWFNLELLLNLDEELYIVGRWSEIGTYDSDEGYHFDGRFPASSWDTLGDDASRFTRLSLALGWRVSPRVLVKLELGWDLYELIDASSLDAENDKRWFLGSEIVLTF